MTHWLRPSGSAGDEPRWGHADGIQVGLHPIPGPGGLLRIFTPYLGHARDRLVNYIAVEPIPAGRTERGYSELEQSSVVDERGKRFWGVDDPHDRLTDVPASGIVSVVDGVEQLLLFVVIEPFDNGADVYLRVRFRADRPHEVAIAAFRRASSVELDYCVISATMGNYARLRRLQLADRVVTPAELWPGFGGSGFAEHATFPLSDLSVTADGSAYVEAMTDEESPQSATYADGTKEHWKYVGDRATQFWRVGDPDPRLEAVVNARAAYWASESPIPGGASFENFELMEPFREGREFVFVIEPLR